jgi:hypothetical protein
MALMAVSLKKDMLKIYEPLMHKEQKTSFVLVHCQEWEKILGRRW